MDALIKAAVAGGIGAVAALVVKKDSAPIAAALGIAAAFLVFAFALDMVSEIIDFCRSVAELSGISGSFFSPLLKTVGIGLLTRVSADICKDSGSASTAAAVELAGSVSALYTALPLMKTVLEMINSLL